MNYLDSDEWFNKKPIGDCDTSDKQMSSNSSAASNEPLIELMN